MSKCQNASRNCEAEEVLYCKSVCRDGRLRLENIMDPVLGKGGELWGNHSAIKPLHLSKVNVDLIYAVTALSALSSV